MGLNAPRYPRSYFSSKVIHMLVSPSLNVLLESPASLTTIISKLENKNLQKTMIDKVYSHSIMLLLSTLNLILISSKYLIYTSFLVV